MGHLEEAAYAPISGMRCMISHIIYLTNPCPRDYRDIHPVTTPVSVMMNQNWYASGVLYSVPGIVDLTILYIIAQLL
jgi:hypothetical protein